MKKNTVKQLLLMNNYYSLNKTLVSRLGIEEAFFICLLTEAEQLFKGHEKDGYFFQTAKEIETRSGLSSYKQRNIIASLEEKGLIKTDLKGIPAKRYFKLEYESISNFIFEKEEEEKEERGVQRDDAGNREEATANCALLSLTSNFSLSQLNLRANQSGNLRRSIGHELADAGIARSVAIHIAQRDSGNTRFGAVGKETLRIVVAHVYFLLRRWLEKMV